MTKVEHDYLRQMEIESFERIKNKWHKKFLREDKTKIDRLDLNRLAQNLLHKDVWVQDHLGNWKMSFPGVFVHDENSQLLPYEIMLPADAITLRHSDFTHSLVDMALGNTDGASYINSGTRGWGGKIKCSNWDLAAIYLHEIDITGIERLQHMNLLRMTLKEDNRYRVPHTLFATTNFCVATYIDGPVLDYVTSKAMEDMLDEAREDLLDNGMWDCSIKIDSNPSNCKLYKGKVYNIDPVYRRPKFIL